MKKGCVGIAKHFSKKYGNKGWAFIYNLYLQSEINFCYVRMLVNALCYIPFSGKDPAKGVFNIKHT